MSSCLVCGNAYVPLLQFPKICEDCAAEENHVFDLDWDKKTESERIHASFEMLRALHPGED